MRNQHVSKMQDSLRAEAAGRRIARLFWALCDAQTLFYSKVYFAQLEKS